MDDGALAVTEPETRQAEVADHLERLAGFLPGRPIAAGQQIDYVLQTARAFPDRVLDGAADRVLPRGGRAGQQVQQVGAGKLLAQI